MALIKGDLKSKSRSQAFTHSNTLREIESHTDKNTNTLPFTPTHTEKEIPTHIHNSVTQTLTLCLSVCVLVDV